MLLIRHPRHDRLGLLPRREPKYVPPHSRYRIHRSAICLPLHDERS